MTEVSLYLIFSLRVAQNTKKEQEDQEAKKGMYCKNKKKKKGSVLFKMLMSNRLQ